MQYPRLATLLLLLLVVNVHAEQSAPSTQPAKPFTIEKIARTDPPMRVFVVKVDLTDPRLEVVIASGGPDPDGPGPWETVLAPTSTIAKQHNLDLAVNGVFFSHDRIGKAYLPGAMARSSNRVVSKGKVLSDVPRGAAVIFDAENRASVSTFQEAPKDAYNLMAGNAQLVAAGEPTRAASEGQRAPRTAAGVSKDGRTLILLVVDGRRDTWSVGMTLAELAKELIAQGAHDAINLDGGGSTALVARDEAGTIGLVNLPSDGSNAPVPLSIERPVPYILGIRLRDAEAPAEAGK